MTMTMLVSSVTDSRSFICPLDFQKGKRLSMALLPKISRRVAAMSPSKDAIWGFNATHEGVLGLAKRELFNGKGYIDLVSLS